jgi:hypothetical protein
MRTQVITEEDRVALIRRSLAPDVQVHMLDEIVPAVSGDRYVDMNWVRIEAAPAT